MKTNHIFIFLLLLLAGRWMAQPTLPNIPDNLTPNGIFDEVHDRFGNKYNLSEVSLFSARPFGSSYSIATVPTESCTAGYFNLYFGPNTVFTTGANSVQAQGIICDLYNSLSNFIQSPCSGNGVRVNVLFQDGSSLNPGQLASGTSVYLLPPAPANPNAGLIDGLVYQTIVSGVDPYTTVPVVSFLALPNSGGFYHGVVSVGNFSWSVATGSSTINPSEFDLYSVMLHEAAHLLGFASSIGANGTSSYGATLNYYYRYDTFLRDFNGAALLVSNSGTNCANAGSSYVFNTSLTPSVSICQSTCSAANSNSTNCSVAAQYSSSTVVSKVYTPVCFEPGSSLCHFEDICNSGSFTSTCTASPPTPGYNDFYFSVSNVNPAGTCGIKRHYQEEERFVFCDLGYTVSSAYTSTAATASKSYTGSCPSGSNVIGVNDGYNALTGVYSFTTASNSVSVALSALLANDQPSTGLSVACIEPVYNTATCSISGSSVVVSANLGSGAVLLRYYPVNASGVYGNVTYVWVFFSSGGACSSGNNCNLVQNGDFEALDLGSPCGNVLDGNNAFYPNLCSWDSYGNVAYRHAIGCTDHGGGFNLGTASMSFLTPIYSYNGSPAAISLLAGSGAGSVIKNYLTTPLIPTQTYQVSFWAWNIPTSIGGAPVNPNSIPAVISLASNTISVFTPSTNFPAGLNSLINFSINPGTTWSQVTGTFVYSGGAPAPVMVFGLHSAVSSSLTQFEYVHCFIDDLSITPVPSATFSIPQPTACGFASYGNLGTFVSGASAGTFSGTGVSFNGSQYQFNPNYTLTPGAYPIVYTYTNGACTGTLTQVVTNSISVSLYAVAPASVCVNGGGMATMSVSPNLSGPTFTWQPGNLTGSIQVVAPTAPVVYTINSSGPTAGHCPATQTLFLNALSNCCGTLTGGTSFTQASINFSYTFLGGSPLVINNSFTIQANSSVYMAGPIIMANGVKITVADGAGLSISGAHLYACDQMWEGIEVKDGGALALFDAAPMNNLIEDAVTAIDVSDQFTTTLNPILTVTNTVFNKNLVDIRLHNYQRSSNTYSNAFAISGNVFTCRDYAFTNSYWPQVITSTLGIGLTGISNPTTGLEPPYVLLSAPQASLKPPYASQSSSVAIQISSVGITSGTNFYGIGIGSLNSPSSDVNLFDMHGSFIHATNSNITPVNNVFQNTIFTPSSTIGSGDGAAIYSGAPGVMNNRLDMRATSYSVCNRFWNCHYGVYGYNLYNFDIENTFFRSMQTSTNTSGVLPGNTGILLNTNRAQYRIVRNEFTNVRTGINVPLAAAAYSFSVSGTGIYATNMSIQQNTLSAGTSTAVSPYMNRAIYITAPNQASWTVNNVTNISPFTLGIIADDNRIADAYNGIGMNGVLGWRTSINGNTIALINDGLTTQYQRGIELVDFIATPSSYAHIVGNEVYSSGGDVPGDTARSMIFASNNTGSYLGQPSLVCNYVHDAHNGFLFEGPNQGSSWYGNKMKNLAKGMVLSYTAVIGAQGSPTMAMGNQWLGPAWGGTNFAIYTRSSTASSSTLYATATGTPNYPINVSGNPFGFSYGVAVNSVIANPSGGNYDCFASNLRSNSPVIPQASQYADDESFYIGLTALYRFLYQNDSIKNSKTPLSTFFSHLSGSSIDEFCKAEDYLIVGDLTNAGSVISAISPTNGVETSYVVFYNLYMSYAANRFEPTNGSDESDLESLCLGCPGTDGACVYQARALHNAVFKTAQAWPVCSGSGSKLAPASNAKNNTPYFELFPNPAQDRVTIKCSNEQDVLSIRISDLSGRLVFGKVVKVTGFIANLDLSLLNGAYVLRIINQEHEQAVKKLIIAK